MTMRWTAAVAVLVSGLVHLWLWWFDSFRDIPWIGPLFLLNFVAGAVIAVLLVVWRSWLPPLVAVGFGASTLGCFLLSATVGFLGVHEPLLGTWQITAGIAEIVAIVAGGAVLLQERAARSSAGETQNRFALRRTHLD